MTKIIKPEKAQSDDSIFTEFEPNPDPETCFDTWGAYCPQPDCGELNTFQGNPVHFANRPYMCRECGWVSLMHESVKDIHREFHVTIRVTVTPGELNDWLCENIDPGSLVGVEEVTDG